MPEVRKVGVDVCRVTLIKTASRTQINASSIILCRENDVFTWFSPLACNRGGVLRGHAFPLGECSVSQCIVINTLLSTDLRPSVQTRLQHKRLHLI